MRSVFRTRALFKVDKHVVLYFLQTVLIGNNQDYISLCFGERNTKKLVRI